METTQSKPSCVYINPEKDLKCIWKRVCRRRLKSFWLISCFTITVTPQMHFHLQHTTPLNEDGYIIICLYCFNSNTANQQPFHYFERLGQAKFYFFPPKNTKNKPNKYRRVRCPPSKITASLNSWKLIRTAMKGHKFWLFQFRRKQTRSVEKSLKVKYKISISFYLTESFIQS